MSRPSSHCHLTFHQVSLEELRPRSIWSRVGPVRGLSHPTEAEALGPAPFQRGGPRVGSQLQFGLFQEKLEHNGLSPGSRTSADRKDWVRCPTPLSEQGLSPFFWTTRVPLEPLAAGLTGTLLHSHGHVWPRCYMLTHIWPVFSS